ncbi:MAG: DNA mismatch repair protein MutS [Candidatus Latescibacteria bacterium]|nr:DNA mismatch repair protein MutS [Candidatus Latescibacterota bacterium]NIM21326.1 DNA mismatch repair protein MutS [Candidatus Latescibacterota bacterium]NIM65507.1 DNA mismatch repair protein MutS [Candidatus Latescibacterota bacterium]NIO01887.1 DNA mismatch repair protein MutS [Candidatus Latescibacterota bacterium]NIO28700.1 DNA mismatch repair protein MutS [Candidatus Latescibacterota bacterium]
MNEITPLMAQYRRIKRQYHDCILLFRVGDFYETFYEDAVEVSRILNIALTTRDKKKKNPVPLAGVPFHAAENYVTRLIASGKKVAVCEQVEDPAQAKGLVKREVVEVLTPGTSMNAQLLEEREDNFCLSICLEGGHAGIAAVDVSTGDFFTGEAPLEDLHHLVQGKRVKEILAAPDFDKRVLTPLAEALGNPYLTESPEEDFTGDRVFEALRTQFGEDASEMAGELAPLEQRASGALLRHCHSLRNGRLPQVVRIRKLAEVSFLGMDDETIGNLELFQPLRGGVKSATLIETIDRTQTAMGGREIRKWLQKPLLSVELIDGRLQAVEELMRNTRLLETLSGILKGISDMPRIAARIAARKAIPREFHALRESLEKLPALIEALGDADVPLLRVISNHLDDHGNMVKMLDAAIVPDPPGHLREGGVIKKGFSPELDELIEANETAKRWVASLEKRERERTRIGSLKVGYNKVFGYYIEVSKANIPSVPPDYIPKQTLVNSERYFTAQLKEKEQMILETEEKRVDCEQKVFEELCEKVASRTHRLQTTSHAVAQLDVLLSLAIIAKLYGYRRPAVDATMEIEITSGRHPVLERIGAEPFVPNDLFLHPDRKQFALITGPNMSGKSTFLRQVALIVILAQMGSFVPAERARIGLVDKIFTRVGASDRLSRGESTFLVEMNETANILNNMTDRSLVLLDEIGRGTSTYDGLSIAWAVTEYLLQGVKARPRTLFATHFHDLTQLKAAYSRLFNLKITIKEWEGGIIFLRKIVPGTSDKSYGIHAARIAGLPSIVLKRAEEILHSLELRRSLLSQGVDLSNQSTTQYKLFGGPKTELPEEQEAPQEPDHDTLRDLKEFDIDRSSPLEALQFIKRLKDRLDK